MKANRYSITKKLAFAMKLMLIMALFNFSASVTNAQNSEDAALKAVIKAETNGYYDRNTDAWQGAWLQDAKSSRMIVYNNNYSATTGWEKFGPQMVTTIKENPKPIPVEITTDNFIIHLNDNMAWVEYEQTLTAPTIDPKIKQVSREHRALLKKDGQWKIITQITVGSESFASTPEAIENNLNANGYLLMKEKKTKEAIEVFKVNAQLYPQSWNTFDSLGEAYAMDGDKKQAIKNYEKSIELNPKNEAGKLALAKLKQKEGKPKVASNQNEK